MEANAFQVAVIAELTALKYVLEHVGKIAFVAADLRPEHATAMRETAREKLLAEVSPGLGAVWSDHMGAEIADNVSAILTNIETAVAEAYRQAPPQV
jgi:hypothetical protein